MQAEYIDCIEDMENMEETLLKSESWQEVCCSISKLPEEEKDLINMLFYQECSLKAYAEKKGIGYFQAFRKKKQVLGKLSHSLNSTLS
jgi:DNA-directed RNA polymerase specialized sigma subunit